MLKVAANENGHAISPTRTSTSKSSSCQKMSAMFDRMDKTLDTKMPNSSLQTKLDHLGNYIQGMFAPLKEFNAFLESNGEGGWVSRLAISLLKLPLRAARNIVCLLYNVISSIIYGLVHPLKGLSHLAQYLISLFYELTKPETWSKMGVGMIGASLGTLALGSPLALVGMLIGVALTVSGLTVGVIKTAVQAETGHKFLCVWRYLLGQCESLSESMLTGFYMGLALGTVQRIQRQVQAKKYVAKLNDALKKREGTTSGSWSHEVKLQETSVIKLDKIDAKGNITVSWDESIQKTYRYRWRSWSSEYSSEYIARKTVTFTPSGTTAEALVNKFTYERGKVFYYGYLSGETIELSDLGVQPLTYSTALPKSGAVVIGATESTQGRSSSVPVERR